jgi:hypothetical protein
MTLLGDAPSASRQRRGPLSRAWTASCAVTIVLVALVLGWVQHHHHEPLLAPPVFNAFDGRGHVLTSNKIFDVGRSVHFEVSPPTAGEMLMFSCSTKDKSAANLPVDILMNGVSQAKFVGCSTPGANRDGGFGGISVTSSTKNVAVELHWSDGLAHNSQWRIGIYR